MTNFEGSEGKFKETFGQEVKENQRNFPEEKITTLRHESN